MRPLVSVIMPVCNGAPFVGKAIQSILLQSFHDFELIVVDDGSTDETPEILERFLKKDPRIIVLRHEKPLGISLSCNEAATHARGKFLARMDADDIAMPQRLETQLQCIENRPECVALGTWAMQIDPDGWPIGYWRVPTEHEAILNQLLSGRGGAIIHPTAMIRRSAFNTVGGYDESLRAGQDADLWLRLAEIGRLANVPEILLYYRFHLSSVTWQRQLEQALCLEKALLKACQRRGMKSPINMPKRPRREMTPYRARRHWVRIALANGFFRTAAKHAKIMWQERPFDLIAAGLWLCSAVASLFGDRRLTDSSLTRNDKSR